MFSYPLFIIPALMRSVSRAFPGKTPMEPNLVIFSSCRYLSQLPLQTVWGPVIEYD